MWVQFGGARLVTSRFEHARTSDNGKMYHYPTNRLTEAKFFYV